MDLRQVLTGALVLAPLTKGGNLPYRRLCVEQGAVVTMGEMALVRKLRAGRRGEFALLRRAPEEQVFGVQLAERNPEDLEWGTALAAERGADFVDLNLGCPIEEMTRRGLGAALLRKPGKVSALVAAMKRAGPTPVTVKIRLGWGESSRNHLAVARAAVDGGVDAIFVHGRTRSARYRREADWDAIGEIAAAVPVPVIGNGDILWPGDVEAARARSGCAGVMTGRGALIKPWIFREVIEGPKDPAPWERLACMAHYAALAREHWGEDDHGLSRVRSFLVWHQDFWSRYRPRRADGSFPALQERSVDAAPEEPLAALLARSDLPAREHLADCLLGGRDPREAVPPRPAQEHPQEERVYEG
jgi:tRNA-dihydrouridine synthase 3